MQDYGTSLTTIHLAPFALDGVGSDCFDVCMQWECVAAWITTSPSGGRVAVTPGQHFAFKDTLGNLILFLQALSGVGTSDLIDVWISPSYLSLFSLLVRRELRSATHHTHLHPQPTTHRHR